MSITDILATTQGSPETSSHKITEDTEHISGIQSSDDTTITLNYPEKLLETDSQKFPSITTADKERQASNGVYLSHEEYKLLLRKASFCPNVQNDILKIRSVV